MWRQIPQYIQNVIICEQQQDLMKEKSTKPNPTDGCKPTPKLENAKAESTKEQKPMAHQYSKANQISVEEPADDISTDSNK